MTKEDFTLVCVLEHGKKRLKFTAPKRYQRMLERMGIGEEFACKITDPARDLKHNSKLHGVLHEVADALGWETSEFKEYILPILRPAGECPITGKVLRERTHDKPNEWIDQLVVEIKAWTHHQMPGFVFKFDQEAA